MGKNLEEFLEEAVENGSIECPVCGNIIEVDCDECYCGWRNPITEAGLI